MTDRDALSGGDAIRDGGTVRGGGPTVTGDASTLVRVDGLSAGYGRTVILRDLSFAVHAGERVAVLGPNGGGKTTLFRVLLGELQPFSGTLTPPPRCGLVPQTERSRLDFPVSALDVALMGTLSTLPWWRRPGRAERRAALEALTAVGLEDRAGDSFGALSGGQRQRVLVARALVQNARVLLLDEPFTGMDNVSQHQLERLLSKLAAEGRALLIATHDVDQARGWDRVLCLNGRQIAYGRGEDVLTPETLRDTYGAELVELPGTGGQVLLPAHHHDHGDGHGHAGGHEHEHEHEHEHGRGHDGGDG